MIGVKRKKGGQGQEGEQVAPQEDELPSQLLSKYEFDEFDENPCEVVAKSWKLELKDFTTLMSNSVDMVAKIADEDERSEPNLSSEIRARKKKWAKVQLFSRCFVCLKDLLQGDEHWNAYRAHMELAGRPAQSLRARAMNDSFDDLL